MPDCTPCRGTGRATSMPLCDDPWNEVVPGLFQGGHDVRSQSVSACVVDDESATRVDDAAEQVADAVRDGRRVLVRCSGGLNRSGLVVASALVRLGHPPADAIALVRAARGPWALTNPRFASYLRDLVPNA